MRRVNPRVRSLPAPGGLNLGKKKGQVTESCAYITLKTGVCTGLNKFKKGYVKKGEKAAVQKQC